MEVKARMRVNGEKGDKLIENLSRLLNANAYKGANRKSLGWFKNGAVSFFSDSEKWKKGVGFEIERD